MLYAPSGVQSNTLSTELHLRKNNSPTPQCPIATPNTHIHESVVASTHPVSELPYAPGRVEIVLLSPQTIPASPGAMSIMFACSIGNHQSADSTVRPDTNAAMRTMQKRYASHLSRSYPVATVRRHVGTERHGKKCACYPWCRRNINGKHQRNHHCRHPKGHEL